MSACKSANDLAFAGFLHPLWEFAARKYFTDHDTPYTIDGFRDSILVCKNFEQHVIPSHLSDTSNFNCKAT